MSKLQKTILRILRGTSDRNIDFDDMRQLLLFLGFEERIRGNHHIFTKDGVTEILNLQPKGKSAKAYQVKQVRNLLIAYKLTGSDDEQP